MTDGISSGGDPFVAPAQVTVAIEPLLRQRDEIARRLAELDRLAAEIGSARLRAGSRGAVVEVSDPEPGGPAGIDACLQAGRQLEQQIGDLRSAPPGRHS